MYKYFKSQSLFQITVVLKGTLRISGFNHLISILFLLFLLEILQISLIETETESNPNRLKHPRETSVFLWKSLEMFVMMTGEVSGIRLHRFLNIAFSSTYCTWHNFSFLWFIQTR